jgi:MarR family 2-MHQ and catechol resistance regulon transcriptional repressor
MAQEGGSSMIRSKQKTSNLPPVSERAFRQLIRTFGLLERVMQPYFAQFGISGAQWGVLRNLHRAEGEGLHGLRLTDLSRRMLIRPPSVTGIVDRLERMNLIVRSASATDLRAKKVELTGQGRRLVEKVLTVHSGQIMRVMNVLPREDQEELYRLLDRLGEHLERMAESKVLKLAAAQSEAS